MSQNPGSKTLPRALQPGQGGGKSKKDDPNATDTTTQPSDQVQEPTAKEPSFGSKEKKKFFEWRKSNPKAKLTDKTFEITEDGKGEPEQQPQQPVTQTRSEKKAEEKQTRAEEKQVEKQARAASKEEEKAKELQEARQQFEKALEDSRGHLAELDNIEKVPPDYKKAVQDLIDKANPGDAPTTESYKKASKTLAGTVKVLEHAQKKAGKAVVNLSELRSKYETALDAAEKSLAEVEKTADADAEPLRQLLERARQAAQPETEDAYKNARDLLGESKALAKSATDAAHKLGKRREEYNTALSDARQELQNVPPGYTNALEALIAQAEQAAQAETEKAYEDGRKLLDGSKALAKEARKEAENDGELVAARDQFKETRTAAENHLEKIRQIKNVSDADVKAVEDLLSGNLLDDSATAKAYKGATAALQGTGKLLEKAEHRAAKELADYKKALDEATERLKKVQTTPDADAEPLRQLIERAENEANTGGGYEAGRRVLDDSKQLAAEATEAAHKLSKRRQEYQTALDAAEKSLAEVEKTADADAEPLRQLLERARQVAQPETEDAYKNARDLLGESKALAKSATDAAHKLGKRREEYNMALSDARQELQNVPQGYTNALEALIAEAEQAAQDETEKAYEDGRKLLDGSKALAKEARKEAEKDRELREAREAFEKARTASQKDLEDIRKIKNVSDADVQAVEKLLNDNQPGTDATTKTYKEATAGLQDTGKLLEKAENRAAKEKEDYDKALDEAKQSLADLTKGAYADFEEPKALIKELEDMINQAEVNADTTSYVAGRDALSGSKDKAKQAQKVAADLGAAHKNFTRALNDAEKRLPGLKQEGISDVVIATIQSKLQKITVEAEAKKTAEAYTSAAAAIDLLFEFKKDRKARPKYDRAARKARKLLTELKARPGTETQREELEKLLQKAEDELGGDALQPHGHLAALEMLKGAEDISKRADQAEKEFKKKPLSPDCQKAYEAANEQLGLLRKDFGPYLVRHHEGELSKALVKAKSATPEQETVSAGELNGIAKAIQDAIEVETRAREDCTSVLQKVEKDLETLKEMAPASAMAHVSTKLATLKEDLLERYYSDTLPDLQACQREVENLLADYNLGAEEWKKNAGKLAQLTKQCGVLLDWGPVSTRANLIHSELLALPREVEQSRNFEMGNERIFALEPEVAELQDLAGTDTESDDFKNLEQERKKAKSRFDQAVDRVADQLNQLEALLPKVKNKQTTRFHQERETIKNTWFLAYSDSEADSMAGVVQRLQAGTDNAVQALATLEKNITLAARTPLADELVVEVQLANEAQDNEERAANVARLKVQLQQMGGEVPTTADLKELEKQLLEEIKQREEVLTESRKAAEPVRTQVQAQLKKLEKKKSIKEFAGYFKSVEDEVADLEVLLSAQAPDLIEQAKAGLEALQQRLTTTQPDDYKAVTKKHQELSGLLGNEKILKYFKETSYRRLHSDLQTAITEAWTLPPQQALERINQMEDPIKQLVEDANAHAESYKEFEGEVKELKQGYKQLAKLASAEAYGKKLKERLEGALTLAGRGGQLDAANATLKEIRAELEAIQQGGATALQERNTAAEQDNNEVANMAKVWEKAVTSYKDLLKKVETAVKEEGKQGALKKLKGAGKDADQMRLKQLQKVPTNAGDIVKKYKKDKTVLDVATARRDFTEAHRILSEARAEAEKLLVDPSGGKVQARKDLAKINEAWEKAARRYARAVQELKGLIQTDANDSEGLPPIITTAVDTVTKKLDSTAKVFKVTAFARHIEVLSDDSVDESKRKTEQQKALRTMRRYVKRLLNDPIMKGINDPANPFVSIRAATATLRRALKNLELNLKTCV